MGDTAKADERSYLRKEIEANKRLVFERALLIAGATFAASILSKDTKGVELLGLPAIGALAFNLWFTVNRLFSNARIVAYVQLFHEQDAGYSWIGWENALRQYRIWHKCCHEEKALAEQRYAEITQYDSLSFFTAFLTLHLATAWSISVFMVVRTMLQQYSSGVTIEAYLLTVFILNIGAAITITLWAYRKFRPEELKLGIEKCRILWEAIMESYTNGDLRKIESGSKNSKTTCS